MVCCGSMKEVGSRVTRRFEKKSPNGYKKLPKNEEEVFARKMNDCNPFSKIAQQNVATGFKKLQKYPKLAQCGHTGRYVPS